MLWTVETRRDGRPFFPAETGRLENVGHGGKQRLSKRDAVFALGKGEADQRIRRSASQVDRDSTDQAVQGEPARAASRGPRPAAHADPRIRQLGQSVESHRAILEKEAGRIESRLPKHPRDEAGQGARERRAGGRDRELGSDREQELGGMQSPFHGRNGRKAPEVRRGETSRCRLSLLNLISSLECRELCNGTNSSERSRSNMIY